MLPSREQLEPCACITRCILIAIVRKVVLHLVAVRLGSQNGCTSQKKKALCEPIILQVELHICWRRI